MHDHGPAPHCVVLKPQRGNLIHRCAFVFRAMASCGSMAAALALLEEAFPTPVQPPPEPGYAMMVAELDDVLVDQSGCQLAREARAKKEKRDAKRLKKALKRQRKTEQKMKMTELRCLKKTELKRIQRDLCRQRSRAQRAAKCAQLKRLWVELRAQADPPLVALSSFPFFKQHYLFRERQLRAGAIDKPDAQ